MRVLGVMIRNRLDRSLSRWLGPVMDWPMVLPGIDDVLGSGKGRAEQAIQIAEPIRQGGSYRWVGRGPGAPAHPRCPVTQGLSGAAVAGRRAVVVNGVTADLRYLTAFASTLSEAIVPVPVVDPGTGMVVGTLDVESAGGHPLAAGRRARRRHPPAGAADRCLEARIKTAVVQANTSLVQLFGVGPVLAATFLGGVGDIGRFPSRHHFAAHTGTAPLEASSGQVVRHRLGSA